ncbi:Aste57867_10651 [Aphanomyces stellatus]|uniref:Aste57867_10651 protein n=1 Tax=Aphanomyces stellatus TaxID=120398 RepID=A0A485KRD0_9STRA|nr:hypothetical protein As57867_010611 [Aphanomyces stellatus]VFT87523.1 Aste57867_10651 [Aphanomyces stellatus]
MSPETLQEQQRGPYTHANQEADLEEVYAGARRLNHNARAINGEVVEQNHLIDHLGNDIESGTGALQTQTAKAELVNANKKKLCKMYWTIFLLVVVLIGLNIIASYLP